MTPCLEFINLYSLDFKILSWTESFVLAATGICCNSLHWMYTLNMTCPDSNGYDTEVRSECLTCTFKASCYSARLSWAQVPTFAGSSVWDRKKKGRAEGVSGDCLHWRVQGSTSNPTRIGSRRRVV